MQVFSAIANPMSTQNSQKIIVSDEFAGERLDKFLTSQMPDMSRSRIQSLIADGQVTNEQGKSITSAKHKVVGDEVFLINIPEPQKLLLNPEAIDLEILFEDDHLIVINKQYGLAVHPAPGQWTGTLVHGLLHHCGKSLSGINGVERPGIVHRLDKDTSGVMVIAKDDVTHRGLAEQFEQRTLTREYLALCYGFIQPSEGEIEGNIGRNPKDRKKMAVVDDMQGKPAVTLYSTEKRFATDASLIRCTLRTGRTHQIRVHLSHLGHGIIGDPVYGKFKQLKNYSPEVNAHIRSIKRQMLHAAVLGFIHPITNEELYFETDVPADFQELLNLLQN